MRRPGWKRRLLALGLTVVAIVGGLVIHPLLVAVPRALAALTEPWGLSDTVNAVWKAAYWPTVGPVAALLLTSLYHFAVPRRTPWRRDLPGAALAMVVWLLGGVALRSYASATIETDAA
ncbi:MAG: YihY/virulence factor BrkB family protein [Actinomycetota bacterium]|nr:YihY/virulence factor BrkB family protein [Actinomycetota bacterium]